MTDPTPIHILLVEDNPADARLITEYVSETEWGNTDAAGPSITHVDRLEAARDRVTGDTDIVLLDLDLPDSTGVETLDKTVTATNTAPVVVLTGLDDERIGRDAVKRGAQDYLVKDDITPRLLQQTIQYAIEREQQQQELQRRNAELALLTQVVRHDIRNDLSVIMGWGESLESHVSAEGETYLRRMLRAGEHISSITENVGEFLDVLEGSSEPELYPVDLNSVLTNEIDKAQSAYEDTTITTAGDINDELRVAATDLLSSVFRNLLNNAVLHNDKPEPEITVHVEDHGDTVTVRIADNGPGISDEQKKQIFGRGSLGLESSGSGIGLYLVDTLVEMYDGEVVVEDNDPEGSVFSVTLST